MNVLQLSLKGFKCHKEASFDLNNLTILTGSNSSGKSSIIQSILIHNSLVNGSDTLPEILKSLSLGSLEDLLYRRDDQQADSIIISLSGSDIELSYDEHGHEHASIPSSSGENAKINYLSAERVGPRQAIEKDNAPNPHCGRNGQRTAEVIDNNYFSDIPSSRTINSENVKFSIALDQWTDYIFPGTSIRIKPYGDKFLQVTIRNNQSTPYANAPNMGFGISYALPIIVSGLLAQNEEWLVIENPEAHLHAKAQSNMGFFLAQMAAAGVRILLETHSEHIVNGIRRFIVTTRLLSPEDATIYFLPDGNNNAPLKISIDSDGNLSDFPVDFFDQARQDLLAIINTTTK